MADIGKEYTIHPDRRGSPEGAKAPLVCKVWRPFYDIVSCFPEILMSFPVSLTIKCGVSQEIEVADTRFMKCSNSTVSENLRGGIMNTLRQSNSIVRRSSMVHKTRLIQRSNPLLHRQK